MVIKSTLEDAIHSASKGYDIFKLSSETNVQFSKQIVLSITWERYYLLILKFTKTVLQIYHKLPS